LVVVEIVVVAVADSAAVVVSYQGFVMLVVLGQEEGLEMVVDFLISIPQNDIFYGLPSKSKSVALFMLNKTN
jgi:hypothetical protein